MSLYAFQLALKCRGFFWLEKKCGVFSSVLAEIESLSDSFGACSKFILFSKHFTKFKV